MVGQAGNIAAREGAADRADWVRRQAMRPKAASQIGPPAENGTPLRRGRVRRLGRGRARRPACAAASSKVIGCLPSLRYDQRRGLCRL